MFYVALFMVLLGATLVHPGLGLFVAGVIVYLSLAAADAAEDEEKEET